MKEEVDEVTGLSQKVIVEPGRQGRAAAALLDQGRRRTTVFKSSSPWART